MILVFGATGTVGKELVSLLSSSDSPVRVFRRKGSPAIGFHPAVEVYEGDLNCEHCLFSAMHGVERIFSLAVGPQLVLQEQKIATAAKLAGVRHIVKLSVLGARSDGVGGVTEWHGAAERAIEKSGVAWTHLRPGAFMSNATYWSRWIKAEGRIYSNFGSGALALIHPRDIAVVALRALTESVHEGKIYSLTGGEALTTAEQVAVVSRVANRKIGQIEVSDEEARRLMQSAGMPQYLVDALVAFAPNVRAGRAAAVLSTTEEVLGRKPLTFEQWVGENFRLFTQ